ADHAIQPHVSLIRPLYIVALRPQRSTLFPYTTLFRSEVVRYAAPNNAVQPQGAKQVIVPNLPPPTDHWTRTIAFGPDGKLYVARSEEHTSELQSPYDLVCRLLLEKKKNKIYSGLYVRS